MMRLSDFIASSTDQEDKARFRWVISNVCKAVACEQQLNRVWFGEVGNVESGAVMLITGTTIDPDVDLLNNRLGARRAVLNGISRGDLAYVALRVGGIVINIDSDNGSVLSTNTWADWKRLISYQHSTRGTGVVNVASCNLALTIPNSSISDITPVDLPKSTPVLFL